MKRYALFVLLTFCLIPSAALAREGGPGPQRPLWPKPGMTDAMLYAKAMTLQAQMWHHLSPEGLLVYRHTRGASKEVLSHESVNRADAAIWTGCYAAAMAARWAVTKDPDALEQARHLARGLRNLSLVTEVPGRLARNVGVAMQDLSLPHDFEGPVEFSKAGYKWRSRIDVSRDQLAGVVMGWYFLGTFIPEDPEIQQMAREQSAAIARRLVQDKMWMRDKHGKKTEHGELRNTAPHLPFIRFGAWAAIGLATLIVAADLNPEAADLQRLVVRYDKKGWDGALPHQLTWFQSLINSSDVNMVALSLVCIAMSKRSKEAQYAKDGIKKLRGATVGWWNAGICSCWLLGGHPRRNELVGEIRVTLHRMPDGEYPRTLVREYRRAAVAPVNMREISSWHWTNNVRWFHIWKRGGTLGPEVRYTGADYLFAYWLARLGGALKPMSGPGAVPTAHHCAVDLPPWMQAAQPK